VEHSADRLAAAVRSFRFSADPQAVTGLHWRKRLLAVFALALAVRLLYLWQWHDTYLFSVPVGDGRKFILWAQEIAAGDWLGHEVFFHTPLYPYLLGVAFKLFGDSLWVPRLINVVIGAASCVFVAQTGALLFSRTVGIIAGIGLALYAPAIFLDGLLQKTALGVFFSTLGVMLWAMYRQRPNPRTALLIGLAFALATEVHESSLAFLAISALWFVVGFGKLPWRARLLPVAALLLGAALVFVPVGLRNQHVGGSFLITTYNFGTNFWYGNNPNATGHHVGFAEGRGDTEYESVDTIRIAEGQAGRALSPAEASRYWTTRSLSYIAEAPRDWLVLTLRKYLMAWYHFEWHDTDSLYAYMDESSLLGALAVPFNFSVLMPLAMIGLVATARRWRELWPLYLGIMGTVASVAFFVVFARYRFPLVPILMLFAAVGIREIATLVATRRLAKIPLPYCAAAVLAIALGQLNFAGFATRDLAESKAVNFHGIGLRLIDQGRLAEAESALSRAISLKPEAAFPIFAMSMLKARQQRIDEQVQYLRRGLQLAPAFQQARRALSLALIELGKQRIRLGDAVGAYASLAEAANTRQFLRQDEFAELAAILRNFRVQ
jgi:4-amino-4-deoxy-L-arabinose transferase-like glycosyltransferase